MQIRTAVSPAEIGEAITLSRSKKFWLKFFAANWYGTLICLVVIGADVNLLANHQAQKLGPSLLLFVIMAGLMVFSYYRWQSKVSKALQSSHVRIESQSLDSDGIRIKLKTGTETFVPWSSYNKWTEGKNIFLLTGTDGTTIIPTDDGNRDALRGMLSSRIS